MSSWKLLCTIDTGTPNRYSTESLSVSRSAHSDVLNYVGALSEVSIPDIGNDSARGQITIPTSILNPQTLRAKGVSLVGAPAEMSLWRPGTDYSTRFPLLVGIVSPGGEQRYKNKTVLQLDTFSEQSDRQFPPWILTSTGFPSMPAGSTGKTLPVIYGECDDVPLIPLGTYDPATLSINFAICGSPLSVSSVTIRPDGRSSSSFTTDVYRAVHVDSGALYSYVTLSQSQMNGATTFVADGVVGNRGQNGNVLDGLGDVIDDAIRTYSKVTAGRIDEERMSRFRSAANRIRVASVFGGTPGPTIIKTLQGRYENNFPVHISWRGGKIGADYLGFDLSDKPVRNIRLGAELLDRLDPVEMESDAVYTDFSIEYDRNIVGNRFRSILTADPSNSSACARAASRFGRVKYQTLQIPDINDGAGARAVLDWLVDRYTTQRTKVRYLSTLDTMLPYPPMSAFSITDPDMRWTAEKFRLQVIRPRLDGLCECEFVSYRESP